MVLLYEVGDDAHETAGIARPALTGAGRARQYERRIEGASAAIDDNFQRERAIVRHCTGYCSGTCVWTSLANAVTFPCPRSQQLSRLCARCRHADCRYCRVCVLFATGSLDVGQENIAVEACGDYTYARKQPVHHPRLKLERFNSQAAWCTGALCASLLLPTCYEPGLTLACVLAGHCAAAFRRHSARRRQRRSKLTRAIHGSP